MRAVRLIGARQGYSRSLRAADFESLSISDQSDDVTWDDSNHHIVVLKNKVADQLVAELGEEFEIIDDSEIPDDDE